MLAPRVSLAAIAALSGIYDVAAGALLLAAPQAMARWFGAPSPVPPILAELNGLFLVAVGVGYVLPWRDPDRYRGYLWVMGPLLKGGGALAFVLDHLYRASPGSFLLFAATDGTLALLTLWALLASRSPASAHTPS
jgi:hypothetical protein